MTIIGPEPFAYATFDGRPPTAFVFYDRDVAEAVVIDSPNNRSTSVTNAVEAVARKLRTDWFRGEPFQLYTVSPDDPWMPYSKVTFEGATPSWQKASPEDSELLGTAQRWLATHLS